MRVSPVQRKRSDPVMDRRLFIVVAAGGLVGSLPMARAQPARSAYRIGYLRQDAVPVAERFWARMSELGWVEGRNVAIEPRYGAREQLRELAADLVRSRVDLILTVSTPASLAAREATATIPIVFLVGADPVARGLVASLARPGGNLTGYALGLYDEKMLETLKAALPRLSRVALPAGGPPFPDTERAARDLGLELREIEGLNPDRFDLFFANARKWGADALFIPNIAWLSESLARLGGAATSARLPAIGAETSFASGGGLLAYGPTSGQHWPRIASQVDKILRGAKPAELPVEQPSRFTLAVNLEAAKALGVVIPQLLLLSADEVIY
jgi:putative ABC transport system substrate-binding protein